MALKPKSEVREVYGITDAEKKGMYSFLQGAIYSWCKNNENKWFAMRDLMGGENFNWEKTPLMPLYNKHINMGKNQKSAVKGAGVDSGWILKKVIDCDKRTFESDKGYKTRQYKWIKNP